MSGGVDSSVAAYLLQIEGYEVIGLFMRNWDSSVNNDYLGNPNLNDNICPQEQDYNDAVKVCEKLNIPLHRVDYVKEYWDNVFTYFLDELNKGRTPNPDVMCNKYIKIAENNGILFKTGDRGVYEVNPWMIAKGKWENIKKLQTEFEYVNGKWRRTIEYKQED